MIVIEHDMKFVEDIAHKVTVLHQGKILSEGTMENVQERSEGDRSLSRALADPEGVHASGQDHRKE